MILWLIAHVGCWPRSACAACHHVCPRACSNADFHTPSPISSDSHGRLASCPREMLRRAGCQNVGGGRAQAAGGTHHHICPCACRVQQCWIIADFFCQALAVDWRRAHVKRLFRVEVCCQRANFHCGTLNGNGAWNLSLSVFQAMSHFQTQSSERLK